MNYNRLLEGRIAAITSGAHGMGYYVSRYLAQHGAVCIINGRDPHGEESARELRKVSPDSFFIQCDMSKKDDVDNYIDKALAYAGHVDVVANVVGINTHESWDNITDDNFEYNQQVNLYGVIRIARGFIPGMIKAGGGSFVHISTIHSVAALHNFTSYATSKSAINAFSGAIAAEYGQYGIRSNVVCPGGIYSKDLEVKYNNEIKNDPEKLKEWIGSVHRDIGHPDFGNGSCKDIANACLFYLSDMSRHVTGTVAMCDGGASFQSHYFRERRMPPDIDRLYAEFMMNRF